MSRVFTVPKSGPTLHFTDEETATGSVRNMLVGIRSMDRTGPSRPLVLLSQFSCHLTRLPAPQIHCRTRSFFPQSLPSSVSVREASLKEPGGSSCTMHRGVFRFLSCPRNKLRAVKYSATQTESIPETAGLWSRWRGF